MRKFVFKIKTKSSHHKFLDPKQPDSMFLQPTNIVKWGKKWTIPTNLSFNEIHQCLNIKIGFQAVKIYVLTFSSCIFTSYLQPVRNKLLKTLSVFYPTKWGKYCPKVRYNSTAVCFLHHCLKFLMFKTQTL